MADADGGQKKMHAREDDADDTQKKQNTHPSDDFKRPTPFSWFVSRNFIAGIV